MDTNMLYYKIYEGDVKPCDYRKWAMNTLDNERSSASLNILSALEEPLNIFEVEDYFNRASSEIDLRKPSHEECAQYFINHLIEAILRDENNAIEIAYEIYIVSSEHINTEDLSISKWYGISEMIDDFRYGDNVANLTRSTLISVIVQEAENQLSEYRK